jgi:hypothetical protein
MKLLVLEAVCDEVVHRLSMVDDRWSAEKDLFVLKRKGELLETEAEDMKAF